MNIPRNALIALWCVCHIHIAVGQTEWFPVGAEWHYCEGEALSPVEYEGFLKVMVTGDSVIQQNLCQVVECDWLCWNPAGKQYVYQSGDSVFLFDPFFDSFKLIYNFNALPGDSIIIPIGDEVPGVIDTVVVKIDSLDTVQINGFDLRKQFVRYHVKDSFPGGSQRFSYTSEIIEIIGDMSFIFNIPEEASRICDANFSCGLRCYEDAYLGHYETGIAPECTYTYVGIDDPTVHTLRLYPNPTDNIVKLVAESEKIIAVALFDLHGRKVLSFMDPENISLADLDDGLYVIRATGMNNIHYTGRIVKIGH